MTICTFCGFFCCKECVRKERNFPKSKLDKQGNLQRGAICNLCDRTYLLRQMLLEDGDKIQKVTAQEKRQADEILSLQYEIQDLHMLKFLRRY